MNRQITLAARPAGLPKPSDFALVTVAIPELGEGEVLSRVVYLSVDPYMRGRMTGKRGYADPIDLGDVIVGGTVSKVIESKHPRFAPGDYVQGMLGWQDLGIAHGNDLRKIDPQLAPLSTALGVLGMPGLTAYFGLLDIGRPQPGDTVAVSGAAGAVGSIVGQIAKIKGCRVVGIAGTDAKVEWLTGELGFDAAFNYKTTDDYYAVISELCPRGVDVYFDNVGGAISDAVIRRINPYARIALCGQISQYNVEQPEVGPRIILTTILVRTARLEGFLVYQFTNRYKEGIVQMARWLAEGKLNYREQFTEGLESAPEAFIGMLTGANTGKQLVKVSEP